MAVINIDDAYILDETGAQVDKVTGLFTKNEGTTSGEKAFAQLNIGTAGSNRNLLDNPWFTVRQRGNGPFVAQYSADRWYASGGGLQVTLGDGGATLAFSATYREFRQAIANPTYYANGTYTMSVKVTGYTSSGSIRMQVHDGASANVAQFTFNSNGIHTYTFKTGANGIGRLGLYNIANASATMTVEAVKLELGSVSTLANDGPPELSIARIPCYENHLRLNGIYSVIGTAIALSSTLAVITIPTPVTMRIAPTASLAGTLYFNNGTPFTVKSINSGGTLGVNCVTIQANGSFTAGSVYLAQFRDANSYIDLSADL